MDIIVTTPKSAHNLAAEEAKIVEENPDAYWFRTIRGKPNVQVGDRVYYVDNGEIRGYGVVFDIEYGELECEATGKVYNGTHLKQREWVRLEKQRNRFHLKAFKDFVTSTGFLNCKKSWRLFLRLKCSKVFVLKTADGYKLIRNPGFRDHVLKVIVLLEKHTRRGERQVKVISLAMLGDFLMKRPPDGSVFGSCQALQSPLFRRGKEASTIREPTILPFSFPFFVVTGGTE